MKRILLAGFGGQGVLFVGKFLAYHGLEKGQSVSWLPSYGPEMRGGTANCSVILAEENIGSPIVSTPDILLCMNLPSMDKFEPDMEKGGMLFYNSSMTDRGPKREDIKAYGIPATQLASDNKMDPLANVIMLGKLLKETGMLELPKAKELMKKIIPEHKQKMLEANQRALEIGYNWE